MTLPARVMRLLMLYAVSVHIRCGLRQIIEITSVSCWYQMVPPLIELLMLFSIKLFAWHQEKKTVELIFLLMKRIVFHAIETCPHKKTDLINLWHEGSTNLRAAAVLRP